MNVIKNERGLTLIELLSVIVILAIIAAIALPSVSRLISNAKADAHLANARHVLEAGKIAHLTEEPPGLKAIYDEPEDKANAYTLKELTNMGLLNDKLKNPSFFKWSTDIYDSDYSYVIVEDTSSGILYKVNLSIKEKNYIFGQPKQLDEINRNAFSDFMKEQFKFNKD